MHGTRRPCDGTAHGLLPWIGFQPVNFFLLKPDRLEAYPTCLASVDHTQTDRAHRAGLIDDCRVMIVDC